jgi:hypothetical protein
MKAIGKRVVVQKTETQIKRAVIVQGEPEYNYSTEIVVKQLGEECPPGILNIGDKVLLGEHTRPSGMKLISPEKDKEKRVFLGIVWYDEIVGIDDNAEEERGEVKK